MPKCQHYKTIKHIYFLSDITLHNYIISYVYIFYNFIFKMIINNLLRCDAELLFGASGDRGHRRTPLAQCPNVPTTKRPKDRVSKWPNGRMSKWPNVHIILWLLLISLICVQFTITRMIKISTSVTLTKKVKIKIIKN